MDVVSRSMVIDALHSAAWRRSVVVFSHARDMVFFVAGARGRGWSASFVTVAYMLEETSEERNNRSRKVLGFGGFRRRFYA